MKDNKAQYSEHRKKLHHKIIRRMLKKAQSPPAGQKPICILLGGGTASGKTTLRETIIEQAFSNKGIDLILLDADIMKSYIPEYKKLTKTNPSEAAVRVHQESLHIASLLLMELMHRKHHFILEGTLSKTQKYMKLVQQLKRSGFIVQLYMVDLPLEVAIQRSDQRGEKTGRIVPHSIIKHTHKGASRTFAAIKHEVDCFKVYNNSKGMQLIASNTSIMDQVQYDRFIQKGGCFRIANQIRVLIGAHQEEIVCDDLIDELYLSQSFD